MNDLSSSSFDWNDDCKPFLSCDGTVIENETNNSLNYFNLSTKDISCDSNCKIKTEPLYGDESPVKNEPTENLFTRRSKLKPVKTENLFTRRKDLKPKEIELLDIKLEKDIKKEKNDIGESSNDEKNSYNRYFQRNDDTNGANSKQTFKSAETVTMYKRRDCPYNKNDKKESVFDRLGPSSTRDESIFNQINQKRETDPQTLDRRQKQIDYGKNTVGYDSYRKMIKKSARTAEDPQTPNKRIKYSRRGWDGLIKQWRLKLHKYDPKSESEEESEEM